jgi:hypothetical protein
MQTQPKPRLTATPLARAPKPATVKPVTPPAIKPAAPTPPPAKPLPAWVIARRRAIERRAYEVGKELVRRFPRCFQAHDEPKLPLAIGIAEAIYAACNDIDKHDLINAISDYADSASYLRSMVAGAERVDLNGTAVDVVKAGHEVFAKLKLSQLIGGSTDGGHRMHCDQVERVN